MSLRDDWYRERAVTCLDCGVLCLAGGVDADGWAVLYDVARWEAEAAAVAVGVTAWLKQGFGVGNGRRHRCPPCLDLTEVTAAAEGGAP